jgi:hypothetical protein
MNEHLMQFCFTYLIMSLCSFRFEQRISKLLRFSMFSGIPKICFRIVISMSVALGLVMYAFDLTCPLS